MENLTIKSIESDIAGEFILKCRDKSDQITFNNKGKFWGCYNDNDILVGVISTNETKNTIRVKSFLTRKLYRNLGIGAKLLQFIIANNTKNKEMTTFATRYSCNIFANYGFEVVSENKNNIKFMRRIQNV